MNLWGCDLLQQRITQINIFPTSETNQTLMCVYGKNIGKYYKEQSLIVHVTLEQSTIAADLSNTAAALLLKHWQNKCMG